MAIDMVGGNVATATGLGRWRLERDSELVVVRLPARLVKNLINAGEPCAGYVAMGQASLACIKSVICICVTQQDASEMTFQALPPKLRLSSANKLQRWSDVSCAIKFSKCSQLP